MIDWIAAVLGEEQDEETREERPALDGAAEVGRLRPPRMVDGAEDETETEELPDAEGPDWADGPRGGPDAGTDWARVRVDEDGVNWTAEMEPGTGRTVWTLGAAERGRGLDGTPDVEAETDGTDWPGLSGDDGTGRPGLSGDVGSAGIVLAGLAELYRGAAEGARALAPPLVPEAAGRTALERENGGTVGLTVEELDRAVRRDSRRYDGGMSIF